LTCFPFVAAAWVYRKPLLPDRRISVQQIAWFVRIGGGMLAASGSATEACVMRRRDPHDAGADALLLLRACGANNRGLALNGRSPIAAVVAREAN
jgi:hypothetical protein